MELKVLVNGEERTVSGVNETTTCEAIILAIAKASSQDGKYEMVEKFRNMEKRLGSKDKPLEILQRYNEHASSVTFILKRISDEDDDGTYDTIGKMRPSGYTTPLPTYRQPSTSSITSAATVPNPSLNNSQWSSSSLPAAVNPNATHTHVQRRNRPPPPDYKTVMEQKFASLSRGPQSRPPLPPNMTADSSIAGMRLSENDLRALIEEQRASIEKQKENLSKKEMIRSDEERELLQLQRQQENLRIILQPLRSGNWNQQYQKEFKRSQKLKAQIEATKEAIDKTKTDVDRLLKEEDDLKQQIQIFKAENPPLDLSPMMDVLKESPQKSPRKVSAY